MAKNKGTKNSDHGHGAVKASQHWKTLKAGMQARVLAKNIMSQVAQNNAEIKAAGEQAVKNCASGSVGQQFLARRKAEQVKRSEIKNNAVKAVDETKTALLKKGWSVNAGMWSKPQAPESKTALETGKAKLKSTMKRLAIVRAFSSAVQGKKSSDQSSSSASVAPVAGKLK